MRNRITKVLLGYLPLLTFIAWSLSYVLAHVAHFYYDTQATTSIVGKRYYLVNMWGYQVTEKVLQPYRWYYQHLTPEQQQQMRTLSKKTAGLPQQLVLINTWLVGQDLTTSKQVTSTTTAYYKHASFKSQSTASNQLPILPTTNLKQLLNQQIYTIPNRKLIPQLPAQALFAKYLIGSAGDIIDFVQDSIFINGIYIHKLDPRIITTLQHYPQHARRIVLQPGQYWISGDSDQSIDSSFYGPITKQAITGKVWYSHS